MIPVNIIVLAGGGPNALAWHLGALETLAPHLDTSLPMIGTSAGAIAGAVHAHGSESRRAIMAALRTAPAMNTPPSPIGSELAARMSACHGGDSAAIRDLGQFAMAWHAKNQRNQHITRIRDMVGTTWPRQALSIVTRSTATGQRVVFAGDVPFALAVAASSSAPHRDPPVLIGDTHYFDGGIGSPVNADLAAGADAALILESVPTPAHELDQLAATGTALSVLRPTRPINEIASAPEAIRDGMAVAAQYANSQ